ncbi:MAG: type II toxin-antitoxin system ParD family antitoxin [Rhodospirillales bacterium]|nr:type II toxin-antitoxin system ParD family antitoxin [Rhodospirillales bacterium]MBI2585808.1 type II toxin-antitoxin system ParD family antitoxin [Rhodospirillales bacterium]
MNISLSQHFRKFVKDTLKGGRFKSASELVREGLRLLEERETRLAVLRREIAVGRDSGDPIAYDPDAIKRRGRAALQKSGETRRRRA